MKFSIGTTRRRQTNWSHRHTFLFLISTVLLPSIDVVFIFSKSPRYALAWYSLCQTRVACDFTRLSSADSDEEVVTAAVRNELYKLLFAVSAEEFDALSIRDYRLTVDKIVLSLFTPSLRNVISAISRSYGNPQPWRRSPPAWKSMGFL